jgi:nucleoside-triphosphatase
MTFHQNILITGPRQIGKSTCVRNCLADFPELRVGGFITEPASGAGLLTYQMRDISSGTAQIFARQINSGQPKFHVDPAVFDYFGREILARALEVSDLIVMDEIGVMEQTALFFQQQIFACLEANTPVLAVVKAKENPFLARLKARSDCSLIELSPANRDEFQRPLTEWLRKWI